MYQDFITSVLEEASNIARSHFGKVSGVAKGSDNNQVLTETDVEIGQYIIGRIQQQFPTHNIIDEEAGVIEKSSEYTWVIDPIDGTSNFANGVAEYGTLLGLLKADTPIAGGMSLPSFHELYVAEKGSGAFCNDKSIKVTEEQTLLSCLIAYGIDGHQEDPERTHEEAAMLGNIILGIRNLRSSGSAYDAAMVAKGCYGVSAAQTSKIWDNVGPHIILEEAGATYTDFLGNPMDYTDPLHKAEQNYTWCAAPPSLHQQMQSIIHAETKN
jgi:myo-inositol-1(or 4)-monophosphatase